MPTRKTWLLVLPPALFFGANNKPIPRVRARFDLAVPDARWALEIDVFPTHAETVGRERDALRDAAAAALGWRVCRIGAREYGERFETAISRAIRDLVRWQRAA